MGEDGIECGGRASIEKQPIKFPYSFKIRSFIFLITGCKNALYILDKICFSFPKRFYSLQPLTLGVLQERQFEAEGPFQCILAGAPLTNSLHKHTET